MSRLLYPFSRLTGMARRSLPSISTVIVLAGLALASPQYAAAEATPGPEPIAGPSGLPDGRVYEQVSPQNKPGSEAGGLGAYVVAGVDGNEVAYSKTGPFGETLLGFDTMSISRRLPTGWTTRGVIPPPVGSQDLASANAKGFVFSPDLKTTVFTAQGVFVPDQERGSTTPTPHVDRYDEDGRVQWIGKPTIPDPINFEGFLGLGDFGQTVGGSPDLSTVFFEYEGTLTTADEEANPILGGVSRAEEIQMVNDSGGSVNGNGGFYEWHEGVLEDAAVLPDGHLDPYGAQPAAIPRNASSRSYKQEALRNEVSDDGRKAFFLSPDPKSESGRRSELYVRVTHSDGTHASVLASRDTLLPEVSGQPAPAPDGTLGEYSFYASPDGSRAFFISTDQLTAAAPNDGKEKEYEFDTDTQALIYLPGVADTSGVNDGFGYPLVEILGSSRDGSNFVFKREGELELWSESGVTAIAPLESPGFIEFTRATSDGSSYLFQTSSAFPGFGFNNGNGSYQQVYRYDTAENTLSCISCPPSGVSPSGDAVLSHVGSETPVAAGRSMSGDGSRVFFDTPASLVSQDSNGVRDAYEWEDGTVYLISTGVSGEGSVSGDTSLSGNDVFFSTAEGISSGDTDGGYDVYDARVPRPGDQLPPSAVPCEGAVCQGPPSVPQLLSPPASVTFDGAGDLAPSPVGHNAVKSLTRKQKLTRALSACKHRKDPPKRRRCERQARSRYGAKATRAHAQDRDDNRRGNGRGK